MSASVRERPTEAASDPAARPSLLPPSRAKRVPLLGCIAALAVLTGLFLRLVQSTDDAMSPTLAPGDIGLVNRWTYRGRLPFRGEVVLVRQGSGVAVRRVIGIGGDKVEVRGGWVCIGGVEVIEPYRPLGPTAAPTRRGGPWFVPGGMVLVMNDHDDEARLGRSPAVVPLSDLEGRIEGVIYPPTHRGRF